MSIIQACSEAGVVGICLRQDTDEGIETSSWVLQSREETGTQVQRPFPGFF